jgi:hypothetical protein
MCFSATASFAVGTLLTGAGIYSVRKVKDPKTFFFSTIPIIFGIQQITEGFVWISLQNEQYKHWQYPSILIFLIFAQIIWPAFVPFAIRMMEEKQVRRTALSIITGIGIGVAVYLGVGIFFYPIDASVKAYHIQYELTAQKEMLFNSQVFYFTATVVSAFVSSRKGMLLFGTAILSSMIVSLIYFNPYVISVWCFFAAALSIIVLYVITKADK